MIKLTRPQAANLAYYAVAVALFVASLGALLLGALGLSIVISIAGAVWMVGGMALALLFEPALTAWLNAEPAPEPRTRRAYAGD